MSRGKVGHVIRALVAGALAPVACGGSTAATSATDGGGTGNDGGTTADAGPTLRPGFTPLSCGPDGSISIKVLTATPPFDYIELRDQNGYDRGGTNPDKVLESTGTLCATATDAATCKATFAAIRQPDKNLGCGVPYPCDRLYLATTRGDTVKVYLHGGDPLGPVVAPIDGPDEAAFVVAWSGNLYCAAASQKASGDGWDIAYSYETDYCTTGRHALHDVLVHVSKDGTVTPVSDDVTDLPNDPNVGCAAARRASDVAYESAPVTDAQGWLARAAYLEAASVRTFARLARELRAHGAPEDLVRRVAEAARQERRHAQAMRALAGTRVSPSPRPARGVRSLEAIALENAVEGCARETWGAVVVTHQAAQAPSPELRAAFDAIADDEASHAELATDLDAWLASRLDAAARARVVAARNAAIAALDSRPIPEAIRAPLGLPTQGVSARLLAAARRDLLA